MKVLLVAGFASLAIVCCAHAGVAARADRWATEVTWWFLAALSTLGALASVWLMWRWR